MLRTVRAVRYVAPLREGGSAPPLVEADDEGMYVVKLRGAGQGGKVLIAELVAGEIARAAGLAVPELVYVHVDAAFGQAEPDPELALPLEASEGLNLGLDYLPGSVTFDPVAGPAPDETTASRIVLFDALVMNVDRTPRNANLLSWHDALWLIDHGAALYFQHGWGPADRLEGSHDPFTEVKDHVLLRWAGGLADAAAHMTATITDAVIERTVAAIPASWLDEWDGFAGEEDHRAAYVAWLRARVAAIPAIFEEAERARRLRV